MKGRRPCARSWEIGGAIVRPLLRAVPLFLFLCTALFLTESAAGQIVPSSSISVGYGSTGYGVLAQCSTGASDYPIDTGNQYYAFTATCTVTSPSGSQECPGDDAFPQRNVAGGCSLVLPIQPGATYHITSKHYIWFWSVGASNLDTSGSNTYENDGLEPYMAFTPISPPVCNYYYQSRQWECGGPYQDLGFYTTVPPQTFPEAHLKTPNSVYLPFPPSEGQSLDPPQISCNSFLVATSSAEFTSITNVTPATATVNASQSISFSVAPIDNATIEWWMNGPTAEGTGSGQGTVSFSNNTAIYTAPSVVTPFGGTNTAPVTICADEVGNSANASCANITVVGCPPPTIASVTPDTWFVGKTYKATIIGTNFIPKDNATASCPESTLSITAQSGTVATPSATANSSPMVSARVATTAGNFTTQDAAATTPTSGVTVTDIKIVSPTEITATVKPAASDPTEVAQVTVETAIALANIVQPCTIIKPKDNSTFALSDNNSTETEPIDFQTTGGDGGRTHWIVDLSYTPSSGLFGPYGASKDFSSGSSATVSEQFSSMGGQATVTALCGSGSKTDSVINTITGASISPSTIIDRLIDLYGSSQPTPKLMTGIAMRESTRRQFAPITLYGVSALWPVESRQKDGTPDGSHIGLMQMPTSMQHAFDWTINAQDGVNLFFEKLSMARTNEKNIQKTHHGLPDLTALQLENMAVLLYGPFAPKLTPLAAQYYAPSCDGGKVTGSDCKGGSWKWIKNTTGNADGINYVDIISNYAAQ